MGSDCNAFKVVMFFQIKILKAIDWVTIAVDLPLSLTASVP
jgi:hypothetical protein